MKRETQVRRNLLQTVASNVIVLVAALSTVPALAHPDHDAKILAGVEMLPGTPTSTSLKQLYSAKNSLFQDSNLAQMKSFFFENLPGASRTRGLIYLFGGPDVLFPQVLFPNYQKLLLVGLEPPGQLDDVATLSSKQLSMKINDIAKAYANSLKNSYFITTYMAKDLADKGSTTIIATGLAVLGYELLSIDAVSLSKDGSLLKDSSGGVKGVHIAFRRDNGSKGEVFYFQCDLSDQNMSRQPELFAFIRRENFDSAFYKAASFVSHLPNFRRINDLVLSQASLLVQADDGIPFNFIREHKEASHFTLKLYGLYTPPHKMFGVGTQASLKTLYGQEICTSGSPEDRELWQRVWGTEACARQTDTAFKSVSWSDYLPFRFGYAAVSGPDVLSWFEKPKFGTLQVFSK